MNKIASITCKSAGHALDLRETAAKLGLKTTYFPLGGTDDKHDKPVIHTLGVSGDRAAVNDFLRNHG